MVCSALKPGETLKAIRWLSLEMTSNKALGCVITDQGVHRRAQQKSWTGRGRHVYPGSGARAYYLRETRILASPGEVRGRGGAPSGRVQDAQGRAPG